MDDENHRLNGCGQTPDTSEWNDFKKVYSHDISTLTRMSNEIAQKWGLYQK